MVGQIYSSEDDYEDYHDEEINSDSDEVHPSNGRSDEELDMKLEGMKKKLEGMKKKLEGIQKKMEGIKMKKLGMQQNKRVLRSSTHIGWDVRDTWD
ncbi:hypothetical protein OROGR_014864 [Orobanche gracilis]